MRDRFDDLLDNMTKVGQKRPDLIGKGRCGIGAILSEALVRMSRELHQPDDRACLPNGRPPTIEPHQAIALVKQAGSLRLAEDMFGVSKSALQRAIRRAKQ